MAGLTTSADAMACCVRSSPKAPTKLRRRRGVTGAQALKAAASGAPQDTRECTPRRRPLRAQGWNARHAGKAGLRACTRREQRSEEWRSKQQSSGGSRGGGGGRPCDDEVDQGGYAEAVELAGHQAHLPPQPIMRCVRAAHSGSLVESSHELCLQMTLRPSSSAED
jgi:hypothetical protein